MYETSGSGDEAVPPVPAEAAAPSGPAGPSGPSGPSGLCGPGVGLDAPAGPVLAAVLAGVCPAAVSTRVLVDTVRGFEALVAWASAGQAAAVAEFARRRLDADPDADPDPGPGPAGGARVDRYAADELAAALSVSRSAAADRIGFALHLQRLPATRAALAAGRVGLPAATRLVAGTAALPAAVAAAVDTAVAPAAAGRTPAQVTAAVTRAALAVDPAAAETRHRAAVADRRVECYPQPDGTAAIWALLRADEATAAMHVLRSAARHAKTPDDPRRHGERMADTLLDLLLHHPAAPAPADADAGSPAGPAGPADADAGSPAGPDPAGGPAEPAAAARARRPAGPAVHVVVAAGTLLHLDDQPGHLAGHGPIPASLARQIATDPDATWRRLLTDPADGTLLDVGRSTYRPPAALADHVRARDRTCRAPGCRQPAHRCDLDHVLRYPDGPTAAANLAAECPHHHRMKHHARWTLRTHPDRPGVLEWTDPTGHTHTTYPPRPLDPL